MSRPSMPVAAPPRSLSPPAIDAVVFDLGGVVLDIDFGRALSAWAASAGCPVESLAARFRPDASYEAHERGELDAAGYFAALRSTLGIALSDAEFERGWNALLVGPVAGIAQVIRDTAALRPIYLFSNSNPTHQRRWASDHRALLAPFVRQFVSSELGLRKPTRAAYDHVAAAIGVPPARIGFLDDSAENVTGALRAGWHGRQVGSLRETLRTLRDGFGLPLAART
jgi:putative hydrolase of the HAD superfamily